MSNSNLVQTIVLATSLLLQLTSICFHSHATAGDVDLSFDPGSGVNGPVNAVAVQADGKVIIGGQFTSVRGLLRTNLARLNADGSGDPTFNTGAAPGWVSDVALQPDGKVLFSSHSYHTECDEFSCWDVYDFWVTRLNADGSVDSSFTPAAAAGSDAAYQAGSLAVQSDGKVLVGGDFWTMNGTNRSGIARLNSNGTLDTSFNPGTGIGSNGGYRVGVKSIVVQSDGKVLIGGDFTAFDGTNRHGVARLNANGSLDLTFDPGLVIGAQYPRVESVAVQSDGKILLGGYFTNVNGNCIIRVHSNGTLDNSFNTGTGAFGVVTSVAMQLDGKVIVGGYFASINGTNRGNGIARLNANGGLDLSFDSGTGPAGVASVALLTHGQIFIGGNFTAVNTSNCTSIARLNPDGSLDASFYPGRKLDSVASIVALPDGKVLVGGPLTFINGTNQYASARLNGDGSPDDTFSPNSFEPALGDVDLGVSYEPGSFDYITFTAVALQTDGKVLVAGVAVHYEYVTDGYLVFDGYFVTRHHADGSRDVSFTPALGNRFYAGAEVVHALAVQPDGKVIVGGYFHAINGTNRNAIARLHANGALDTNSALGIGGSYWDTVSALVVQPDGKVLVNGGFATAGGTNLGGIARLNADTSLDTSFNPTPGTYGGPIALQPDGKIIVGLNRLNAGGSLDGSFNTGTGANGSLRTVALQSDGKVLIGGDFTTVNGIVRPHVARLHGDVHLPLLSVAQANGLMVLSWPSAATGFEVQQNTNLNTANWTLPPETVTDDGVTKSIFVSLAPGNRFFRLFKP